MYYNRQIIYLDHMEAGNKIKNAGFLKREETEDTITWNMQIKGLYETDTGFFDLRDETGAIIDKILLKRGTGSYTREFTAGGTSRGGRKYDEICGICIRLFGGREVVGRWQGRGEILCAANFPSVEKLPIQQEKDLFRLEKQFPMEKKEEAEEPAEKQQMYREKESPFREKTEPVREEAAWQKEPVTEPPCSRETPARPQTPVCEEVPLSAEKLCRRCLHRKYEPLQREEKQEAIQKTDSAKTREPAPKAEENDPMKEEFFDDKWEQLCHIYTTIHPFGDEREYLSITPKDFVVLASEYQKMVHNSFLLHGYYNYRHIILGKFTTADQEKYYLGVPGVYYDREKMAAEMFGFEAFEGKLTPAEPGSFGYYMKSVRI